MNNFIAKIFSSGAGSVIDSVSNVADKFITTKQEKAEFQAEIQKELNRVQMEAERMYLEDRNSAREMQKSALNQNDRFSKRYVYYLSAFILLAAIGFGASLLFITIPEENRRMIEMFADIFLFTGAITVINFFFGSSRGSDEKNSMIKEKVK